MIAHLRSRESSTVTIAAALYWTDSTIVAFAKMKILTSALDVWKMESGAEEIITS
jgi:hypothetical protein